MVNLRAPADQARSDHPRGRGVSGSRSRCAGAGCTPAQHPLTRSVGWSSHWGSCGCPRLRSPLPQCRGRCRRHAARGSRAEGPGVAVQDEDWEICWCVSIAASSRSPAPGLPRTPPRFCLARGVHAPSLTVYRMNCGIWSAGSGACCDAHWQLLAGRQVAGSQLYQGTSGSVPAGDATTPVNPE